MMQPEDRKIEKTGHGGVPAELKPFRSLDVWEFCRQGKSFETTVDIADATHVFARLTPGSQAPEASQGSVAPENAGSYAATRVEGATTPPSLSGSRSPDPLINWKFVGHCDREGRCSFQMTGRFTASQECLRCGKPVRQTLEFDRLLRICKSEQEADTLETDENEDAVAAPGKIDALQWLEDEMLLCLPMFPAHEECETGVQAVPAEADNVSGGDPANESHRPFEKLAGLLKGKNG